VLDHVPREEESDKAIVASCLCMLGSEAPEKQIIPERQDCPENEHEPSLEHRHKASSSSDPLLAAVLFLGVKIDLNLKKKIGFILQAFL
jgi:hypothetical protein